MRTEVIKISDKLKNSNIKTVRFRLSQLLKKIKTQKMSKPQNRQECQETSQDFYEKQDIDQKRLSNRIPKMYNL